jgi:hypothetical protein
MGSELITLKANECSQALQAALLISTGVPQNLPEFRIGFPRKSDDQATVWSKGKIQLPKHFLLPGKRGGGQR